MLLFNGVSKNDFSSFSRKLRWGRRFLQKMQKTLKRVCHPRGGGWSARMGDQNAYFRPDPPPFNQSLIREYWLKGWGKMTKSDNFVILNNSSFFSLFCEKKKNWVREIFFGCLRLANICDVCLKKNRHALLLLSTVIENEFRFSIQFSRSRVTPAGIVTLYHEYANFENTHWIRNICNFIIYNIICLIIVFVVLASSWYGIRGRAWCPMLLFKVVSKNDFSSFSRKLRWGRRFLQKMQKTLKRACHPRGGGWSARMGDQNAYSRPDPPPLISLW